MSVGRIDVGVCTVFQHDGLRVPMEGLVGRVLLHLVALEDQAVHRLGIKQRCVEGVEVVVADDDGARSLAVEVGSGAFQLRDFGIDGDDRIGEPRTLFNGGS